MLIFGFKERPCPFCSDQQPSRGRHILAPRYQGDPATLPTLIQRGVLGWVEGVWHTHISSNAERHDCGVKNRGSGWDSKQKVTLSGQNA